MTDKKMETDLNKALEATAADVAAINLFSVRATASVASALMDADPELKHEKAMIAAIGIVQNAISNQLRGKNMWKKELPPAVLGRALSEEYGDHVVKKLIEYATNMGTQVYQKKMRESEEARRKMTDTANAQWRAWESKSTGASLGIDLGAFAVEAARGHAIRDQQAAVEHRKATAIEGGFMPDAGGASIVQTDIVNGMHKEHGAAPSPSRVAASVERAKDIADRADLDQQLSQHLRYPAPKLKGKR